MPTLTVIYGTETKTVDVPSGTTIGAAVAQTGLPLEQPCAGRGTCGKCKVLAETGVAAPDSIEHRHLTPGELALDNRLACCARIETDARVVLSPIVVYSNKNFRNSLRYKQSEAPLGLAIDLGSTTAAAFLTMLDTGEVCAGAASLNQQTVYGADVISRLNAAMSGGETSERLHRLALASINQSVDALKLSPRVRSRIQRVTIVCNVAMHHLLARLPIDKLAVMPFEPHSSDSILNAAPLMDGIFAKGIQVTLPPLIGGFVGSDALACLAYFGFDQAPGPMAAIDLGTNGEVLVTDGKRILTTSTAAGPAFEGVNISCGSRAIDGAITKVRIEQEELVFETIANKPPIGLTGSGLLSLIQELRRVDVIDASGRISSSPSALKELIGAGELRSRRVNLKPDGSLSLTQWDVRELQKAKGAIRAAIDILMKKLDLKPEDMQRVILTGSFGGQIDIDAALELGMLPPVRHEAVEMIANGAGLGAAMFLSDEGFALGESLARRAEPIDLDQNADFLHHYITAMALKP
ncbi:MAG: ASKHA domain-containing protein [Chloroflexi bacterium]|nr:ASKHA domain-containing protein [Chloroflexota bacterium]